MIFADAASPAAVFCQDRRGLHSIPYFHVVKVIIQHDPETFVFYNESATTLPVLFLQDSPPMAVQFQILDDPQAVGFRMSSIRSCRRSRHRRPARLAFPSGAPRPSCHLVPRHDSETKQLRSQPLAMIANVSARRSRRMLMACMPTRAGSTTGRGVWAIAVAAAFALAGTSLPVDTVTRRRERRGRAAWYDAVSRHVPEAQSKSIEVPLSSRPAKPPHSHP